MFETLKDKKANNEIYSRLLTALNGNKKCCFCGYSVIATRAVSMHRYIVNTEGEHEIDEVSYICDTCANKITKSNLNNIRERCYAKNLYPVLNETTINSFFDTAEQNGEFSADICDVNEMVHGRNIMAPKQIKSLLDEYVIGQEKAKKVLSVAVYNHYKRFLHKASRIEKSNVLLIGPTGSGKTLLVNTLSKILDVPLVTIDATELTPAGFKGTDVDAIIHELLNEAEGDISRAEKGIVFIDEIDKLAKKLSGEKENLGQIVQHALLKIIEGKRVTINSVNCNSSSLKQSIDTSNILFVCGGAFEGIDTDFSFQSKRCIGFEKSESSSFEEDDQIKNRLLKYGFIPEFIGRFPVCVKLEALTVENLIKILKEPKDNIIDQYKSLMELDHKQLIINEDAVLKIAEKAYEQKNGARGLRAILEDIMLEVMYEMPSQEDITGCVITQDTVSGGPAEYIFNRRG